MADYVLASRSAFNSIKLRSLSDSACKLFFALWMNPFITPSGVYRCQLELLMIYSAMPSDSFMSAFTELLKSDLIYYSKSSSYIWVVGFAEEQLNYPTTTTRASPHIITAVLNSLNSCPPDILVRFKKRYPLYFTKETTTTLSSAHPSHHHRQYPKPPQSIKPRRPAPLNRGERTSDPKKIAILLHDLSQSLPASHLSTAQRSTRK